MDFNLSSISMNQGSNEQIPVKVLILGSGPAGLSAALYTARGRSCSGGADRDGTWRSSIIDFRCGELPRIS